MTSTERREELMKNMTSRRHDTIANLASEFGVSRRTIERDVEKLSRDYPIYTTQGNGGGVHILDSYHPYRHTLSRKQTELFCNLLGRATEKERAELEIFIREHSYYGLDLLKKTRNHDKTKGESL